MTYWLARLFHMLSSLDSISAACIYASIYVPTTGNVRQLANLKSLCEQKLGCEAPAKKFAFFPPCRMCL
jgi:hypothetical protein